EGYQGLNGHRGIDLGIHEGASVTATGSGHVAFLYSCSKCTADKPSSLMQGYQLNSPDVINDPAWGFGFGNGVVLCYPYSALPALTRTALDQLGLQNGFMYVIHGHMSQVSVTPGQAVNAGTVLGLSGQTGNAKGPHVHLEVHASLRGDEP